VCPIRRKPWKNRRKRNPPIKKKRNYNLSEKALAARRANTKIAHQAPKELIYRSAEKRDAATMANLEKAIAGRNSPEGNERCRMNVLKSGLYARDLAISVVRLGEDPHGSYLSLH